MAGEDAVRFLKLRQYTKRFAAEGHGLFPQGGTGSAKNPAVTWTKVPQSLGPLGKFFFASTAVFQSRLVAGKLQEFELKKGKKGEGGSVFF